MDLVGLISRYLPQPTPDVDDSQVRLARYAELFVIPLIRKQHALADEGCYFVTNNAQTAIASPLITTFTAASPMVSITNTDSVANTSSKSIYLDYALLVTGTAGAFASTGANLQMMMVLDTVDRYSSAGTDLTPNIANVNAAVSSKASVAKIRFGQIVATAASGSARTIVGERIFRPTVSTTVADVTGEQKWLNFGAVEGSLNGSITIANANNIPMALPPIVIAPGACLLIYYVMNGTTPSAQTFLPELGWWER